jgi:hypothetical protein
MAGSNLEGTLPESIGEFVNITVFDVGDNKLIGTIPQSVRAWKNIANFQVYENEISGLLPALPFQNFGPPNDPCSLLGKTTTWSTTTGCDPLGTWCNTADVSLNHTTGKYGCAAGAVNGAIDVVAVSAATAKTTGCAANASCSWSGGWFNAPFCVDSSTGQIAMDGVTPNHTNNGYFGRASCDFIQWNNTWDRSAWCRSDSAACAASKPTGNIFACPWPDGAKNACTKGSNWTHVTDADCTPPPAPGNVCTGTSTQLPAVQCAAWIDFHDSTGGSGWKVCSGMRTNPCACTGFAGSWPVCSMDGSVVHQM